MPSDSHITFRSIHEAKKQFSCKENNEGISQSESCQNISDMRCAPQKNNKNRKKTHG